MSLSKQNRALIERTLPSYGAEVISGQVSVVGEALHLLLDAARAEGCQVSMERPPGAGWSAVPTQEAAHPERLSAEELRLTGAALSEWAWDHLAKGYGTNLTVREVSRLIQAVKATVETAAPSSDRAEGVAALQQAAAEPVAWMSEAALTILKLGRAANHTDLIPGKIGPLRDFVVALYASLVPEPATTDVEREEIARVIDPLTTAADFRRVKMDCTCALCARDIKTLAKADQIKALFASKLPTTQPTG